MILFNKFKFKKRKLINSITMKKKKINQSIQKKIVINDELNQEEYVN